MLTPISLDGVIYVFATFSINESRLFDQRPTMPLHPDTVGGTRWAEDQEMGAFKQDTYQELKQLSCMQNNGYTHIIIRPGQPEESRENVQAFGVAGVTRIWLVPTPETALFRFWSIMNDIANVPPAPIVAGWNMRNDLWPRLVVHGLKHGIKIDPAYLADPMNRYNSVKLVLDLSEVYLQGAYPGIRRVPELMDMLQLFNVQQVCPVNPLVDPNTLARYTPDEWIGKGFMQVTNLLYGMQALVRQYYA